MVAAVDISDDLIKRATAGGLYLARIEDKHFKLLNPANFAARDFAAAHY
jgi:hypothetical protein